MRIIKQQMKFLKRYIYTVVVICVLKTIQDQIIGSANHFLVMDLLHSCFPCMFILEKSFLQFVGDTVWKMIPGVPSS